MSAFLFLWCFSTKQYGYKISHCRCHLQNEQFCPWSWILSSQEGQPSGSLLKALLEASGDTLLHDAGAAGGGAAEADTKAGDGLDEEKRDEGNEGVLEFGQFS